MDRGSRLAFFGALLFAIGLFTGFWSGAAMSKTVEVAIPRLALSAHLNALFGGLWLIAVAATWRWMHLGERAARVLAAALLISTYGNWALTLLASVIGERGLRYGGSAANDILAAGLHLVVVLPALVAGILWCRGLARASQEA